MARRNRPIIRRSVVLLVLAALVVIAIAMTFVDVISPRAMTLTAMTETSVRIGLYYQRNKRLPLNLSVLPVRNGYMNRTADGWKRELIYTIDAGDGFSLGSLGRDGKNGGTGDNADICQQYRLINGEVQQVP